MEWDCNGSESPIHVMKKKKKKKKKKWDLFVCSYGWVVVWLYWLRWVYIRAVTWNCLPLRKLTSTLFVSVSALWHSTARVTYRNLPFIFPYFLQWDYFVAFLLLLPLLLASCKCNEIACFKPFINSLILRVHFIVPFI